MAQEYAGFFEFVTGILSNRTLQTMPEIRASSRSAAVLVPIFLENREPKILFTKRASHHRYHGGHVAFPGGVVDRRDLSPQQAALREAWEEIGLAPQDVQVLGQLDDSMTYAPPFAIYPFVGAISFPYPFKINAREVEKIFAVPLKSFWTEERGGHRDYGSLSEEHYFPEFHRQGELIWGTTASILANFVGILKRSSLSGI